MGERKNSQAENVHQGGVHRPDTAKIDRDPALISVPDPVLQGRTQCDPAGPERKTPRRKAIQVYITSLRVALALC